MSEQAEVVKQAARDSVTDLISGFPIPTELSHVEVLDVLSAMRDEVGAAIRLYAAVTEG
jgi:hypothetical protein